MFTSTSRFSSPAILLVGEPRATHSNASRREQRHLEVEQQPKGKPLSLSLPLEFPTEQLQWSTPWEICRNPPWDLGAPVPQGGLRGSTKAQAACTKHQGSLMPGTIWGPIPTVRWSTWSWLQAAESLKSLNVCPRSSGPCPKPLRGLFDWCGTGLLVSVWAGGQAKVTEKMQLSHALCRSDMGSCLTNMPRGYRPINV